MSVMEFCQWLHDTAFATNIRESTWTFPIIEGIHVLGLAVSIGFVFWFDLRLLGLNMKHQSVSKVAYAMLPWTFAGCIVMFITGGLLFASRAIDAYHSPFWWIKVAALLLAGINIAYFHLQTQRDQDQWDRAPIPPTKARLAGLFSIVLWTIVIAAGRLMAYSL